MCTVLCSSRLLGEGVSTWGVSAQWVCLPRWVSAQGVGARGCLPMGCLPWVVVCLVDWVCPGGAYLWSVCQRGVYLSPFTEFLTHTCENITFPQLRLRTVIIFLL